jgi:hypothetical protein
MIQREPRAIILINKCVILLVILDRVRTKFPGVRFQVLTAANMKMTLFWDVAPSSLVEVYRR